MSWREGSSRASRTPRLSRLRSQSAAALRSERGSGRRSRGGRWRSGRPRPAGMVGREKELKIRFVPGQCELVEEDANIPNRRVLITGATGLLGRAVYKEFNENNWHAVGCGYSRARPKFERVNLLDSIGVHDIIQDFQPHVIVHCAAERRPDVVESQADVVSQLNVTASGNLAKEAAGVGAFLIYISTDYVFDGTNPPYKESDAPNPLNLYGKTKLEGEKAVLENNEGAAVLRIPVLYGEVEKLEESAVTVMFDKVQFSNKSANMDHWQQRFPTNVKDVASVCRQLSEKRMLDPSIKGTFHWSGNEQMTKYEMACTIADAFNLPSSHLRPITDSPVVGALRPRNAQLDCSKLEMLGIGQRTPFRVGIRESLWPFLVDKRWRQTVFH
ncbi:methionine adenosyltransferase 2 subunit beta [Chelonia mydas]|uniref:methionine adenosyltransferase 2 subunit beta n=1 Tax=Chelonia mydas TaxID=8469 RepID=UPI001CAA0A1F|nr:methionine adenosyltransferase 2 subunit beta [Chelonia mydas]